MAILTFFKTTCTIVTGFNTRFRWHVNLIMIGTAIGQVSWILTNITAMSRASATITLWKCFQIRLRFCYWRQCRRLLFCQKIRVLLLKKAMMPCGHNRGYSGSLSIALGSVNLYFCSIPFMLSCRSWTEWLKNSVDVSVNILISMEPVDMDRINVKRYWV